MPATDTASVRCSTMLLRLSSTDIHETTLVDCATGFIAFRTTTSSTRHTRSSSQTTLSGSSQLQDDIANDGRDQRTTFLEDGSGCVVAEISWEGSAATAIRIGEQVLQGTAELFDAAFVKILPDETLLPTRMEYTWRTTPDSLTLLDDDGDVIGTLHAHCVMNGEELVPAKSRNAGHDYFQLSNIPEDELHEILVCYLLLGTLRERLYSITKLVYEQPRKKLLTLSNLRRRATRSIAHLRDSFRRAAS